MATKFTHGPWFAERCEHGGALLYRPGLKSGHERIQIVPLEDAILIALAPKMYQALRDIRMSTARSMDRQVGWENALAIIEEVEGPQ